MKNLIYLLCTVSLLVSCKKKEPKDYVTLSGIITNQNSDSLTIGKRDIIKTIKVNPDGTFSDTLKVEADNYFVFDGQKAASVYLKNGYDLRMSLDAKEFDETLKFEGDGAEANNYLAKSALLQMRLLHFEEMMSMDKALFEKKINTISEKRKSLLFKTKKLDSAFVLSQERDIESMAERLTSMYENKQALLAFKGNESPKFVDYENYTGGTTSLDDLKGKYVYIDIWATWCGPCKREIPFLKEVEQSYRDKNIEFVSVSVDKNNAYDTWRTMVKEKELSGIQLFAGEDKEFMEAYKITGIPRFILIDPKGYIIDADAPRPSNKKLENVLKQLGL